MLIDLRLRRGSRPRFRRDQFSPVGPASRGERVHALITSVCGTLSWGPRGSLGRLKYRRHQSTCCNIRIYTHLPCRFYIACGPLCPGLRGSDSQLMYRCKLSITCSIRNNIPLQRPAATRDRPLPSHVVCGGGIHHFFCVMLASSPLHTSGTRERCYV